MPSLKDLKNRIKSVKSTQKITKAMKMVAAAKLRRAKEAAEAARPYSVAMERLLVSLAASQRNEEMKNWGTEEKGDSSIPQFLNSSHPLLSGTGKNNTHLVIVATGDRGLCGGFNSSIVRAARRKIRELQVQGKTVKLMCVGRKGAEQLQLEFSKLIVHKSELAKKKIGYGDAQAISTLVAEKFAAGEFDVAHIVYNTFKSAISQVVTWQQLIPLLVASDSSLGNASGERRATNDIPYDYEPEEGEILADLLPRNLGVQIYRALLENAASEQGARMSAMDNATRNAGEMIKKLNLKYNRTRQASITKELIEIISGAEAV
jgi:F-type H+-transporting ATPase subunit gamma